MRRPNARAIAANRQSNVHMGSTTRSPRSEYVAIASIFAAGPMGGRHVAVVSLPLARLLRTRPNRKRRVSGLSFPFGQLVGVGPGALAPDTPWHSYPIEALIDRRHRRNTAQHRGILALQTYAGGVTRGDPDQRVGSVGLTGGEAKTRLQRFVGPDSLPGVCVLYGSPR